MSAADAERDRRSGLSRVLEAIDAVADRVEQTRAEVERLHVRLDDLERAASGPVAAVVDVEEVRRAVAAAIGALDIPSTADQVQAVLSTALSVLPAPVVDEQAVVRAVRDVLASTPDPKVDLGPVLDALHRHRTVVDPGPILDAIQAEFAAWGDRLAPTPVDTDAIAAAVGRRLAGDVALATGGAVTGQEALVDLVRRTVAASHRALVTQLDALLSDLRRQLADDQAGLVREVELDVEAIRRALERAGGITR